MPACAIAGNQTTDTAANGHVFHVSTRTDAHYWPRRPRQAGQVHNMQRIECLCVSVSALGVLGQFSQFECLRGRSPSCPHDGLAHHYCCKCRGSTRPTLARQLASSTHLLPQQQQQRQQQQALGYEPQAAWASFVAGIVHSNEPASQPDEGVNRDRPLRPFT